LGQLLDLRILGPGLGECGHLNGLLVMRDNHLSEHHIGIVEGRFHSPVWLLGDAVPL
jgi:hypothetical protein